MTFNITARNLGPNQATGVEVTDVLPAGLTLVSATPSPGTYDPASGRWTIGTIVAGGAAATLTLTVTVDQPGMLTNPATKTAGDQPDPDPSNDSAAAQLNAVTSADVGLMKTVDNTAPKVGETVAFTILASNRGPSPATALQVTDLLPAGLILTAATASQGTYTSGSGVWDIGDLAVGGSVTLTLTATVDTDVTLVNAASKSAQGEVDPNPANDQACAILNAATSADIQVTKAASNPTPPVGTDVTFTVTVRNNGPSAATGVTIDDALPAGLSFVSATASQGTYDAGAGVWSVGALAATQSAVLSLTASADVNQPLTNTASRSGGNELDPNPDNDTSSVSVTPSLEADLIVTKSHGAVTVTPGLPVKYTITVSNAGPSPVLGARVVDTLPMDLTGPTWTCEATAPAACRTASGSGDIDALIDLPAGAAATFQLTAVVAPSTTAPTLANAASVTPPPGIVDTDPRSNSSTDTSVVTPAADLTLVKVQTAPVPPATVSAGGMLVYTIVVRNAGPSDATGVVVADPTPAGLVFSGTTGACASPFPCTLGTLAAGATATITTTYTLPADYNVPPGSAPDPIVNTASVSSATTGSNRTDVEVRTPLGPAAADLSITKSGPSSLLPGSSAAYTIVVTNRGPAAAANVSVDDPTPPDAVFVSTGGDCTTPFPCALGTLLPGETRTITATFDVPPGYARSTLVNTAAVAGDVVDPSPGDQRATTTTSVDLNADVAVTKTASPASGVVAGDEVTFTITASNVGPNRATGVEVTDVLPARIALVSATASQGAYDVASGRWPVGSLAAAQSVTLLLRVRIEPPSGTSSATGAFVNTATIAAEQPDPVGANNTAAATVRTGSVTVEICDNCLDDDADGLVDAEDADCCDAQTLTVTQARLQPAKSRLRLKATMARGAFTHFDPRQQDVRLQIRNQDGEAVCCTIPKEQWKKVLGRVYWFRNQTMSVCPPVKGLCLIVPKKGRTKTVIIAGGQTPSTGLGSPLDVTLSAVNQCVQGQASLRPRDRGGAVFP